MSSISRNSGRGRLSIDGGRLSIDTGRLSVDSVEGMGMYVLKTSAYHFELIKTRASGNLPRVEQKTHSRHFYVSETDTCQLVEEAKASKSQQKKFIIDCYLKNTAEVPLKEMIDTINVTTTVKLTDTECVLELAKLLSEDIIIQTLWVRFFLPSQDTIDQFSEVILPVLRENVTVCIRFSSDIYLSEDCKGKVERILERNIALQGIITQFESRKWSGVKAEIFEAFEVACDFQIPTEIFGMIVRFAYYNGV